MWRGEAAEFLGERDLLLRFGAVDRASAAAAAGALARRWRWSRGDRAGPVRMWRRLLSQRRRRLCLRCGSAARPDLLVVCRCVSRWHTGCLRFHSACCETRPIRPGCRVGLARCWLCGEWSMAVRATGTQ